MAIFLLPISTCNRGDTRGHLTPPTRVSHGTAAWSAGVSPWLGGRLNNASNFCDKVMSDCVGQPEIWTDLLGGVKELARCGSMGGIPDKRADSISLRRCFKAEVFFCSSLRFFYCWLKCRACFFVVTEQLEVIPVFPVIFVRCVLLLDRDLIPSKL